MSRDAIVMLKEDHKEIRACFREFQKASTTPARKGKLVEVEDAEAFFAAQ